MASEGVRSGLKLVLESDKRFLERGLVIREVRVRDEWAVECDYSTDLKVTFGIYDYERGLTDLAIILDRMEESGKVVSTVNVAAERNIPVTFASVEAPESAPGNDSGGRTRPGGSGDHTIGRGRDSRGEPWKCRG